MAPVDAPSRAWAGEALAGEGDPLGLGVGEGDHHGAGPFATEIASTLVTDNGMFLLYFP